MGNSSSRRRRQQRYPVRTTTATIVNNSRPAETLMFDVCDGRKWDDEYIQKMKLNRGISKFSTGKPSQKVIINEQIEQMKMALNNLNRIHNDFVQFRSKLEFSPGGNVIWTRDGFSQFVNDPKFSADEKLIDNFTEQVNIVMGKMKEIRSDAKFHHNHIDGHQDQLGYKRFVLFLENEIDFNSDGQLVKVDKNNGTNPSST